MGNVYSELVPCLVQPAGMSSDLGACYSGHLLKLEATSSSQQKRGAQHLSSLLGSSSGVGPVVPVAALLEQLHPSVPSVLDRVRPQGLSKELQLIFI